MASKQIATARFEFFRSVVEAEMALKPNLPYVGVRYRGRARVYVFSRLNDAELSKRGYRKIIEVPLEELA